MILQCPRCSIIKDWDRDNSPSGPGVCACKSFQYWKVLKEYPKSAKGFVKVLSDKGWQELKGPDWKEDPNGWKKE